MDAITSTDAGQSASACVGLPSEFHTLCGQLTRHYASVEVDVLRAIEWLDPTGKTPPTLSQRVARLRTLIENRTDPISKNMGKSLDGLKPHFERRNVLVHGTGTIANRATSWLWPWEIRTGSKAVIERGFWTAQEMRDFQKDLKSKSDRLHSHVNQLAKKPPA